MISGVYKNKISIPPQTTNGSIEKLKPYFPFLLHTKGNNIVN